jgi:hypothetical protein
MVSAPFAAKGERESRHRMGVILKELSSVVCGRPGGLGIGGWTTSDGAAGEESC